VINMINSPPFPTKTSNSVPTETLNSVGEYLEKNLSERQKKVIDFLDKIEAGDAKKIYKTMLFCQAYPDMPAIELVLTHCLNEMLNSMLRREESLNKKILLNATKEMGLASSGDDISDILKIITKRLSQKEEENYDKKRIRKFVEDKLSVKYGGDKVVDDFVKNLYSKKEGTHRFRHFDQELKHGLTEVGSMISDVEDAFLILASSYLDRIENIKKILKKINTEPFIDDDRITNHVRINITKETEEYFFQNLRNPKWLQRFKEHLPPEKSELESWPQGIYLSKVAKEEPSEVFEIIKPYLEKRLSKNIDVGHFVLMRIFKISENFPDEKNYSLKVGNAYRDYLKNSQNLNATTNSHYVKDFLNDLVRKGYEKLVLEIAEELLLIKPDDQKAKFNDFKTRFNDSANMEDYDYEEVLKVIKNSVLVKSSLKLFETLCKILKNAVDGKFAKESNQRLCFNRSAIEDHEQDQYRNAAEFKLITAIRDVAEYIFENDSKNKTKVIGVLEEKLSDGSDFLIFTRIILHLLRKYPEKQNKAVAKHLVVKERFDNYHIHHEYYLLLKQEFKNLSAANKKKILGFINDGFEERKNTKASDNDNAKKERDLCANRWLFNKLDCINDGLSGEWKKKYQELSKEFQKEERPDLPHHVKEAEFITDHSPIAEEELAKMQIKKIIKFITSWQPKKGEGFNAPNPRGLGNALEKDFEKSPKKYLDGLALFNQLSNPTYPKRLLRALTKYPNKTEEDWIKIIELGKWIADQSTDFKNEEFSNFDSYSFDGDSHWGWCKQEFAKLISESCKSKEQNQIPENLSKNVVLVLKKMILDKDAILEKWEINDNDDDRYYSRAINSCHGEALAALIELALLEFRKNNKKYASEILTSVLDNLISKDSYLEGFAVLGRYLPWINLINQKWVKDNLEAILPKKNKARFNAVWLTYINFVPSFDDMFDLLKDKYLLALENPTDEEKDSKRSNFKLGESIAVFYSRGKIKLEDDLLKKLFKKRPKDGSAMISLIGRWCCNENNPVPKEFLGRFKNLWDWRIKNSAELPISVEEYQSFKWWYKSGLFDRKWALEQLLESAKESGEERRPEIFIIGEKLFEDLQNCHKTAWEVIKLMLKVKGYFMGVDIDFVKQVFGLIEESDWSEIKKEASEVKDEFCRRNKLDEKFVSIYG